MDTFVVQPTCSAVNQNIMELLVMLDALKRASAGRITVLFRTMATHARTGRLCPGHPYRRDSWQILLPSQERRGYWPWTFMPDRFRGFLIYPLTISMRFYPIQIFEEDQERDCRCFTGCGWSGKGAELGRRLNASIAIIDKKARRGQMSQSDACHRRCGGKTAILLDDMIDTGGTIVQAAETIVNAGAQGCLCLLYTRCAFGKRRRED